MRYYLGGLILILTPISVNFIVGLITPFESYVNGDYKDWIPFFGNYLGGIISSFAAFYILYINREDEQKRINYEIKKEELENLKKELASHIKYLDIYPIFEFLTYSNVDKDIVHEEIQRLNQLSYSFKIMVNRFRLLYPEEYLTNYGKEYYLELEEAIGINNRSVSSVIECLVDYSRSSKLNINGILIKTKESDRSNELFIKANKWIGSVECSLSSL